MLSPGIQRRERLKPPAMELDSVPGSGLCGIMVKRGSEHARDCTPRRREAVLGCAPVRTDRSVSGSFAMWRVLPRRSA